MPALVVVGVLLVVGIVLALLPLLTRERGSAADENAPAVPDTSPRSGPTVTSDFGLPPAPGSIYELAVTHRSFAFEQPQPLPHNERLEFLGDSVLGLIVTDLIFNERPELPEGKMAKLRASVVNTFALAAVARDLGIGSHLRLGKGEESSGGRDKDSLLADTFEALIGAVYIDRGLQAATDILVPLYSELIERAEERGAGWDAKTALQEVAVRQKGSRPSYRIASSGPDHDKRFTAHVYVADELYGAGSGRSKKEAEQNAAREALERLGDDDTEKGTDARAS